MSLDKYTDEELRAELKRRVLAKRKIVRPELTYIEFEATVKSINTIDYYYTGGRPKFKPFIKWTYTLENGTSQLLQERTTEFYLKQGTFNKGTSPKVGDRVKLRYRRTKRNAEIFDFITARIISIVEKHET